MSLWTKFVLMCFTTLCHGDAPILIGGPAGRLVTHGSVEDNDPATKRSIFSLNFAFEDFTLPAASGRTAKRTLGGPAPSAPGSDRFGAQPYGERVKVTLRSSEHGERAGGAVALFSGCRAALLHDEAQLAANDLVLLVAGAPARSPAARISSRSNTLRRWPWHATSAS